MYVGGADDRGIHQMFLEVCDNSVAETLAGHCRRIDVVLHNDGSISVQDNGRGINTRAHSPTGLSVLEDVFTRSQYPRYVNRSDRSIQVAGGLHGVGLFAVCALSEWVKVQTRTPEGAYAAEFARGRIVTPVHRAERALPSPTGTCIVWKPDLEIFGEYSINAELIEWRLRELAYLLPKLVLTLHDQRGGNKRKVLFQYPDGLAAFARGLDRNGTRIHTEVPFHGEINGVIVDGAFQYCSGRDSLLIGFANTVMMGGGVHETAFFAGLTRALNKYARTVSPKKTELQPLRKAETSRGLVAVVSVLLRDPLFGSATRKRLDSKEVYGPVLRTVHSAARAALQSDPDAARRILDLITSPK
jgi:DNA gyrase subunit B